jgi:thiamine-phosphate pyrophosphorylase
MERDIYRIIDVNFNRARESLRVAEDYCRLSLGSKALAESLKQLRHDLTEVLQKDADFARLLLERRDIVGDVGTGISVSHEEKREGLKSVASASFKRAEEALRVIEEHLKAAGHGGFSDVETMRYEVYRLEKVVEGRTHVKEKLSDAKLYLLFTVAMVKGDYIEAARSAIEGGADMIQLREKNIPDRLFYEYAQRLRALTEEKGIPLIINDRVDVAVLSNADGVHLGQDDLGLNEARRLLGFKRIIGISTHDLEQAREAEAMGADYIGVGPIFKTGVKPEEKPIGPEVLRQISEEIGIPVFPLGGIDAQNIDEVVRFGARRACVCSAILCSEDIKAASQKIKSRIAAR